MKNKKKCPIDVIYSLRSMCTKKPSVYIIQPCLETGKSSRKAEVYKEVRLLRTKKYFK